MAKLAFFPHRMVHLDFHTSPAISDVGRDFDADEFARTMADAHVDSVTVFAKCHHGRLYYATDRPERHPGLSPGLDLLGSQIDALHRRGIRAPIYISGPVDEYAAATHPEWVVVDPDGKVAGGGPFVARWKVLDMSSPYQDYLAEQFAEVLAKYSPIDGIFLDMCWDQPSVTKWAIDGMRKHGLDPTDSDDRGKYARAVSYAYMTRFRTMLDDAQKGHTPAGIWFNSRPKTNLAVEKRYIRHIEIESLPTGGWGYRYFPYVARFVRPFDLPTLSHTGRFHRSWGDFGGLKPEAALRYECCLMLSQQVTSGVGDQLHPRGRLDRAAYDRIGRVYGYVASCEPWVAGGKIASEIAVLVDPNLGDDPGPAGLGLVRALTEIRAQFDLLPPDADLAGYPLVIVPETTPVDGDLVARLRVHLKGGGALLVSGKAAVDADGKPIMSELGIVAEGESPFGATYLRVGPEIGGEIAALDHVMYERGLRIRPARGATALAMVVEPYFERTWEHFCSHAQTPPAALSDYAAIIGKARAIAFAMPIFTAYGKHASEAYRHLIGACVDRLLPRPLLRAGGPVHLETSVVRRRGRTVVHLLSYTAVRKADGLDIIDDPFPLVDVPIAIRMDAEPKSVRIAPADVAIPWEYAGGYVRARVTVLDGHAMIVVDG